MLFYITIHDQGLTSLYLHDSMDITEKAWWHIDENRECEIGFIINLTCVLNTSQMFQI